MTSKLETIFSDYQTGSNGFVKAVATNCGFGISDRKIRRISTRAETADQFQAIWANEDWWTDDNNSSVDFE